jgi:DNA-cytosine methyltransferase
MSQTILNGDPLLVQVNAPTVTEICCGIGGTRKAFVDAGFKVIQSIDIDPLACEFHKKFWGDADQIDITKCSYDEILSADVLSAGFPCQPFSTSGYRTGFDHEQGNVFLSLLDLIDRKNYSVVMLENVKGLLSNDDGKTFKRVLIELARRYKTVEWITYNLLSIGVPMNRPRIVILAHNRKEQSLSTLEERFFLKPSMDLFFEESKIPIDNFLHSSTSNQHAGAIIDEKYIGEKKVPLTDRFDGNLMQFLFKKDIGEFKVYSGRFWGRTGKTIFYTSENQYSHSVGTSMGGAPTFGFNPEFLSDTVLSEVNKIANYTTNHSGYFVFRLSPRETLRLFGERSTIFGQLIEDEKMPMVSKYKLIGNMFSPDQAYLVTHLMFRMFSE